MKHTEVIRLLMAESGVTQKEITERLGLNQSSVSERISHKNISVKSLTEILDIIGAELIVQPKTEGERPAGQYVLERADY